MDGNNHEDEDFPPTGGRVFGVLTLVIGAGIAVVGLLDDGGIAWAAVAFGVLVTALAWSALLRPRVGIQGEELVLRNMVDTVRVPLGAVEDVVVRQYLAVRAGEKRYTSPAVGRSRRTISKEDLRGRPAGSDGGDVIEEGRAFALFVEDRIRERAKAARDRLGIRVASDEQVELAAGVRRVPAVPEIVWLTVSAVAFVVFLVV